MACVRLTETAENIGYSCNLLREEMNEVFVLSGNSPEDVRQELRSEHVGTEQEGRGRPSSHYNSYMRTNFQKRAELHEASRGLDGPARRLSG